MSKIGVMEIAFTNGIIVADAKTGMVDLRTIEKIGMAIDGVEKMENYSKRVSLWLELGDTKEFISELKKHRNVTEDFFSNELVIKEGKRNFKMWADIMVALKYAMYVNKKLEVEVLDTFINKKILDFRMLGIDYFKELNEKLDTLEDRVGKNNKGIYIQVSRMIKIKLFGEHHEGYDSFEETAEIQTKRSEILKELGGLIDKKYIKTYQDVKEYFER